MNKLSQILNDELQKRWPNLEMEGYDEEEALQIFESILKKRFYETFLNSEEWYFPIEHGLDCLRTKHAWDQFHG